MTDYQPGDLIEATYRGVVRQHQAEVDYVTLDLAPSGYVDLFISAATTINVVKKRSPQVGDSLLGSETGEMPVGSVFRSIGGVFWLVTEKGWSASTGGSLPGPPDWDTPLTIKYIPTA